MALILAICRPQPNWMPRNPKLMFQICQNVFGGFCISQRTPSSFSTAGERITRHCTPFAAQLPKQLLARFGKSVCLEDCPSNTIAVCAEWFHRAFFASSRHCRDGDQFRSRCSQVSSLSHNCRRFVVELRGRPRRSAAHYQNRAAQLVDWLCLAGRTPEEQDVFSHVQGLLKLRR